MRNTRVFVHSKLVIGNPVVLDRDSSHHLKNVLRLAKGNTIHAFDGDNGYFIATISEINKRDVILIPEQYIEYSRESSLNISVGQSITKAKCMDYTIQKSVELGVSSITPLFSKYSHLHHNTGNMDKRLSHWQKIVINACEQCGRNTLPELGEPVPVDEWLQGELSDTKLLFTPGADGRLQDITGPVDAVSLLLGPEGGFSPDEIQQAEDCGFVALEMGPRILRTETASIAAISAVQCLWGDMA